MSDFNYEKEIRKLIRKFGLTREEAEGLINQSQQWLKADQLLKNKNLKTLAIIIITILSLIGIVWVLYKHLFEY